MSEPEEIVLSRDAMIAGLPSVEKADAIRYVGSLLATNGHIDPSYIDAMLEREETVSTYLGNGVAMPHGTFESRDAVRSTGIVVAQYPDGIDWGVGTAYLVIGLAAVGDDHVQVLSHIAEAFQNEQLAERLWTTNDTDFLYESLTRSGTSVGPVDRSVKISGEGGLHARPAILIVELAKRYEGKITLSKGDKTANAASIMSVLALGATADDVVGVHVEGSGAAAAAVTAEIERILTTVEIEL